jgi:hypothetical protein
LLVYFFYSDASFGYPGGPLLFRNLNFGIDLDSRIASKKAPPLSLDYEITQMIHVYKPSSIICGNNKCSIKEHVELKLLMFSPEF